MKRRLLLLALALLIAGCADPEEAPRVQLPVVVDASGFTSVETDLGYHVELDEVRIAIHDLFFAVAGEEHVVPGGLRLSQILIPEAQAHPGHHHEGTITGELLEEFIASWPPSDATKFIGEATLLPGRYHSADFHFARADTDDELAGHTALLRGQATADDETTHFTIIVDSPPGRILAGAPFEAEITKDSAGQIGLRFLPKDPYLGRVVFDGIDFAALPADDDGHLLIEPDNPLVEEAYNRFTRRFQTHDYFDLTYQE